MKKWLNVFLALVMTIMCSIIMVLPVYAAEPPEVSLPVTISLSGTLPNPEEDFKVALKANNVDDPMPEGTVNGVCSMTITGEGRKNFPAIIYDRVGVYRYTVYQVAGTNKKCTYDDTVYNLTVTVSNKTDYSGLEATAVLHPESGGDKLADIEFENKYPVEPEPASDIPKTGDESTPLLYTVLIVVSMGVILRLFPTRKSK